MAPLSPLAMALAMLNWDLEATKTVGRKLLPT